MKKTNKLWLLLLLMLYLALTPYVYGLSLLQMLKSTETYLRSLWLKVKTFPFRELFKTTSNVYFHKAG
ncbi:MAG TPA: hypothetical protein VFS31_16465 [Chitinophagaceae bacterium]|nr:hypothetical protein [Chitinophagaceae bacterium]